MAVHPDHPDPDSLPGGADDPDREDYITSAHDLFWRFYPGGVPGRDPNIEPPEPYLT